MELHFTFYDDAARGRRLCRLEETGLTKSVRAKVGPPQLVARVFNLVGALRPEDFARLQRAASASGEEHVCVEVCDEGRLPEALRPSRS